MRIYAGQAAIGASGQAELMAPLWNAARVIRSAFRPIRTNFAGVKLGLD